MSNLLILDSTDEQLSFLKHFLEKKDYAVKTLNNALDLFSEIYSFKPDLLLLNTVLDGTDGREICKQIRSRPETRHLGILIFSASAETITDYKNCADDFMEKPFNLAVLSRKIKSLLSWIPIRKKAIGSSNLPLTPSDFMHGKNDL